MVWYSIVWYISEEWDLLHTMQTARRREARLRYSMVFNCSIIFDYFLPPGSGSIRRSFADPDPHNNDMLGKLCVGIRGLLPVRVHVLPDHQRERNVLCEPGDAGADVQPPRQQNQRRHLPDSSRAGCL